MNQATRKSWLIVGLMIALLTAACAAGGGRESTGQFLDSAAITNKVQNLIADDSKLHDANISVSTYRRIVTLSGVVKSKELKDRVKKLAISVQGVKDVQAKKLVVLN